MNKQEVTPQQYFKSRYHLERLVENHARVGEIYGVDQVVRMVQLLTRLVTRLEGQFDPLFVESCAWAVRDVVVPDQTPSTLEQRLAAFKDWKKRRLS